MQSYTTVPFSDWTVLDWKHAPDDHVELCCTVSWTAEEPIPEPVALWRREPFVDPFGKRVWADDLLFDYTLGGWNKPSMWGIWKGPAAGVDALRQGLDAAFEGLTTTLEVSECKPVPVLGPIDN